MTDVALVIDNDIVIKLSRIGTYEDALKALKLRPKQVGSLGVMLRYMGRASETSRMRLAGSKSGADRLAKALRSITEIEPEVAEKSLAATLMKIILLNGYDMDEGEVALLAVALLRGSVDMASGDKRSLRSLPHLARHEPSVTNLKGKLICFEQIVKLLCKLNGMPRVRLAVTTDRAADKTLTQAYDMCGARESLFIAAMDMVIDEHINGPAPGWLKPL